MKNKDLKRRIIEISYKNKLSHIGSCLTALPIIDEIYSIKKPDEKFVLSSGHAGLGLYVVIEKHEGIDAEKILSHHGIHPDRCEECHLYCSNGSLGQGLPIAVGMALTDRTKNVYCLISDGECSEGSIWEALRIAKEQKLTNLYIWVNENGWGAYKEIDDIDLWNKIAAFAPEQTRLKKTSVDDFPFLKGQQGHYVTMDEEMYKQAMEVLR